MEPDHIIFTKYPNFREANEDASLLRRAGIPAMVEAMNPAAALYGEEFAEIVLKIPAADEAWAIQVFQAEGIDYGFYDEEEDDEDENQGDYEDSDDEFYDGW